MAHMSEMVSGFLSAQSYFTLGLFGSCLDTCVYCASPKLGFHLLPLLHSSSVPIR